MKFKDFVKQDRDYNQINDTLKRKSNAAKIAMGLATLRKKAGLSQGDVAAKVGWTQPHVAKLESISNNQMPSISTITAFAAACGILSNLVFTEKKGENEISIANVVCFHDEKEVLDFLTNLLSYPFEKIKR